MLGRSLSQSFFNLRSELAERSMFALRDFSDETDVFSETGVSLNGELTKLWLRLMFPGPGE